MGFVDVKVSDIVLEKPAPVPIGDYVFQLQPGAEYRTNPNTNIEELNVRFDVVEGDFAGRPVFVNYPDPTATTKEGKSLKWSGQALKKLEVALGTDSLPGEDPKTYLNRVASSACARIRASMLDNTYVKNGQTVSNTHFGIFTVSPSA
jgi:hypothetical protein